MEISEPAVLARLPRAAISVGSPLSTQVYGLRNGVKRKRQEICCAVDGNSLSIYEVQNGRTLSSYSVPPDSNFACAPRSFRWKADSGSATRRTYIVTKRRNTLQIQCFVESTAAEAANTTTTTSAPLEGERGTVMQIELLCHGPLQAICLTRDNGYFELFTPDLSDKLFAGYLETSKPGARFLVVNLLSASEASKSILKSRPDIIASVTIDTAFVAATYVTSDVTGNSHERVEYAVWPVTVASASSTSDRQLSPVVSHTLTLTAPVILRGQNEVEFSARGVQLILKTPTRCAVFNLTTTVPQKVFDFQTQIPEQISSIAVSDHLWLCSSHSGLHLYNIQFRSLQSSLDLSRSALKRRRGSQPAGPIGLVAYFPQLQRIIATRRNNLVAIDLQMPQDIDTTLALKQSSLLISNIGKAIIPASRTLKNTGQPKQTGLGVIGKAGPLAEKWPSVMKRLEALASTRDASNFEEVFLENLSSQSAANPSTLMHEAVSVQVNYVLTKIFRLNNETDGVEDHESQTLSIVLPSYRLIEWLATQGYLTADRVSRALSATSKHGTPPLLEDGAIISALLGLESSSSVLKVMLKDGPNVSPQELCVAIKSLISLVLKQSSTSKDRSLENSELTLDYIPEGTVALSTKPDLQGISELTTNDVIMLLIVSLERLSERDQRTISASLRSSFRQQDIFALIQFIRQQLFRNGYTRSLQSQSGLGFRKADAHSTIKGSSDEQASELSLDAIVTVLGSCIDVVGPLGLINTGDNMHFVQTLIPDLLSEISRTIEALDDAAFVRGLLRETLRFSESVQRTKPVDTDAGRLDSAKRPGTVITLCTESSIDGLRDSGSSMLPLSLQTDTRISTRKVRKGGGKVLERSKREMGMLQDRLRGPYALERLVL